MMNNEDFDYDAVLAEFDGDERAFDFHRASIYAVNAHSNIPADRFGIETGVDQNGEVQLVPTVKLTADELVSIIHATIGTEREVVTESRLRKVRQA